MDHRYENALSFYPAVSFVRVDALDERCGHVVHGVALVHIFYGVACVTRQVGRGKPEYFGVVGY